MRLKRFLSIVITICLFFSISVLATADNTLVIRENVIFDLQSYGILQGGENGELEFDRNVTRAEFCAFVVRLIGAEPLPHVESFKDVAQGAWYAQDVSTLVAYGLINGNEDGAFRPNDNITYTEAVKILVCALGYERLAEDAGGYPVGYQHIGVTLKLNKGVIAEPTTYLTRGAVALMLYNALDVEILEPRLFGQDMSYKLSGKTFRSLFSSDDNAKPIYMSTGIVTANYYTFLLDPIPSIKYGEVEINGTVYNAGKTNTAELLGVEVEYYYTEDKSGKPTIVDSRPTYKNEIVTLEGRDINSVDTKMLTYYDNEANKGVRLELSDFFRIVKNYQPMTKPYAFTTGEDICKNGFIRLIDNTGDGLYDLAIVEDYNSYRISKVSEKELFTANEKLFDGRRFIEMDADDKNIKIILENDAGEKINLSDIAENDVVSLLQSEDKSVLKCVKGIEAVSGYLTEITDDGHIYIDDESYRLDYYSQHDVGIGDTVTAYLDFRGNVVELERDKSTGKRYAYILGSEAAKGVSDTFQLKVLIPGKLKPEVEIDDSNEDQVIEVPVLKAYNHKVDVLTVAQKITVDGKRMSENEYSQIFSSKNLNAAPDNRLISYKTNSEGVITSVESVKRIGDGNFKVYNAYEHIFGKEGTKAFGTSEDSAVICVPSGSTEGFDDDNYYATLLLNNNQRYEITGYDINPDNSIANVVVITAPMDLKVGDSINSSSKLAVLSKISTVLDESGDEVKTRLEFYSEGKQMAYYVAEGSDAAAIAASMMFGDVFYYALNNADEIYRLSICELGELGRGLIFGERGSNDTERSILGKIADINYNIIDIYENRRVNRLTIMLDESLATKTSCDVNRRNPPPIYLVDTQRKTVRVGSIDDIYVGGGAVFAHIKEYSVKGIVLIR